MKIEEMNRLLYPIVKLSCVTDWENETEKERLHSRFEEWCEKCDVEADTWPCDKALAQLYQNVVNAGDYDAWENEMLKNLV